MAKEMVLMGCIGCLIVFGVASVCEKRYEMQRQEMPNVAPVACMVTMQHGKKETFLKAFSPLSICIEAL